MASRKPLFLLVIILAILSALFFIPSEKMGFVTEVESTPRFVIGYIFFIATVLVLFATRKKTLEQSVYTKGPHVIAANVLGELKLDPRKEASSADLYSIVERIGKLYSLPEKTQEKIEEYIQKENSDRYLRKQPSLTAHDVVMMCLYYKTHQTFRLEEKKRMKRGEQRQIS